MINEQLRDLFLEHYTSTKDIFGLIATKLKKAPKEIKEMSKTSGLTAIPLKSFSKNLIGKKIVIFDLETTGLPQLKSFDKYHSYKKNEYYDSSRIVQIAWCKTVFPDQTNDNVNCFFRKPDNEHFSISQQSTNIHRITLEQLQNEGIHLKDILIEKGFLDDLLECDYVIAHNINFDRHILFNELHRLGFTEQLAQLETQLSKFLCTCKTTYYTKLSVLYETVCGKDEQPSVLDFHKADSDVLALYKILINSINE